MMVLFKKNHGMLWGAVLLSGNVLAMQSGETAAGSSSGTVPSTTTVLQQMEQAAPADAGVSSLVARGDTMFHTSCSQCHATERATSKRKSYEEWLATVHRMAAKQGANIPESQHVPIATYLASMNPANTATNINEAALSVPAVAAAEPVSLNATISLVWRHGGDQVENPGFFPDVWAGAQWRPKNSPFSAQVTACTTCHDGSNGLKLELVEGSLRVDLIHLLTGHNRAQRDSDLDVEAKAGRFIVPFGAYSGKVHPGAYRTLTNPMMYNMGRRVGYDEPVLPMPYSDEGMDFSADIPLPLDFTTRLDAYGVNGLQDGGGAFYPSRSYSDNNNNTAFGGRVSVGDAWVRVGGSFSSGELQSTGAAKKTYQLAGGDVTLRYQDYFRAYYEYARREEDPSVGPNGSAEGHVGELECQLWNTPRITMLVRYDTLSHSGSLGNASSRRFTWGPTLALPGGSLLIINHEHWMLNTPLKTEDVVGFRWVAAF